MLCLQKEFAERMVAQPGGREYSRLSVMAQDAAEVNILFGIPRFCFVHIPKVDSAVVVLKAKPRSRPRLHPLIVNLLFQHKNQSVRNALLHSRGALGLDKSATKALCESAPSCGKRPRELTLAELQELSDWWAAVERGFS